MRVAVVGANGQLGRDVVRAFAQYGDQVHELTHAEMEVSSLTSVANSLAELRPEFVVNTAAMHDVESCQQQPERARTVNGTGSGNLATVTRDLGAALLHISTDYVFDGTKRLPYIESDAPRPLNVYGETKLEGEELVRSINPKHFILRTAALYGDHPCRAKGGRNFVDLMLRLARERGRVRVVAHEFTSPTATTELAQQIVVLSRTDAYGLYHATAEGSCSWYEFAREIFSIAEVDVKLEAASSTEFPQKVIRPEYSVLDNSGLKARELNVLRPWQDALREHIARKQRQVPTAV